MRVFRLCRRPFSRKPLDGRGGLFASGRWHTPRRLVCYASDSLALASLEVLVHCEPDLVPSDLMAIEIDVPEAVFVEELGALRLPRTWRWYPAPAALQRLGNTWLDRCTACVLRVPSALIPSESNFLINPAHRDIRKLRVIRKAPFRFDPRLTSG
ncbi:MAG TPA: RES family NAD+ phosphorylase [Polyangiaceae bacterium]|nr:RES family NAD+ phosphorylase [Polyangiaceae bacterium]